MQREGKIKSSAASEDPQWDDAARCLKKKGTTADGVADDDSGSGAWRGRLVSRLAACDHQKHGEPWKWKYTVKFYNLFQPDSTELNITAEGSRPWTVHLPAVFTTEPRNSREIPLKGVEISPKQDLSACLGPLPPSGTLIKPEPEGWGIERVWVILL